VRAQPARARLQLVASLLDFGGNICVIRDEFAIEEVIFDDSICRYNTVYQQNAHRSFFGSTIVVIIIIILMF